MKANIWGKGGLFEQKVQQNMANDERKLNLDERAENNDAQYQQGIIENQRFLADTDRLGTIASVAEGDPEALGLRGFGRGSRTSLFDNEGNLMGFRGSAVNGPDGTRGLSNFGSRRATSKRGTRESTRDSLGTIQELDPLEGYQRGGQVPPGYKWGNKPESAMQQKPYTPAPQAQQSARLPAPTPGYKWGSQPEQVNQPEQKPMQKEPVRPGGYKWGNGMRGFANGGCVSASAVKKGRKMSQPGYAHGGQIKMPGAGQMRDEMPEEPGPIGDVDMDTGEDTQEVVVREGEYLLNPETVAFMGGGDYEQGVRQLNQIVMQATGEEPGPEMMGEQQQMPEQQMGFNKGGLVDDYGNFIDDLTGNTSRHMIDAQSSMDDFGNLRRTPNASGVPGNLRVPQAEAMVGVAQPARAPVARINPTPQPVPRGTPMPPPDYVTPNNLITPASANQGLRAGSQFNPNVNFETIKNWSGKAGRAAAATARGTGSVARKVIPYVAPGLEALDVAQVVGDDKATKLDVGSQIGEGAAKVAGASIGTSIGGAVGMLGGPLAPVTVPLGMAVGGTLGWMGTDEGLQAARLLTTGDSRNPVKQSLDRERMTELTAADKTAAERLAAQDAIINASGYTREQFARGEVPQDVLAQVDAASKRLQATSNSTTLSAAQAKADAATAAQAQAEFDASGFESPQGLRYNEFNTATQQGPMSEQNVVANYLARNGQDADTFGDNPVNAGNLRDIPGAPGTQYAGRYGDQEVLATTGKYGEPSFTGLRSPKEIAESTARSTATEQPQTYEQQLLSRIDDIQNNRVTATTAELRQLRSDMRQLQEAKIRAAGSAGSPATAGENVNDFKDAVAPAFTVLDAEGKAITDKASRDLFISTVLPQMARQMNIPMEKMTGEMAMALARDWGINRRLGQRFENQVGGDLRMGPEGLRVNQLSNAREAGLRDWNPFGLENWLGNKGNVGLIDAITGEPVYDYADPEANMTGTITQDDLIGADREALRRLGR